MMDLKICLFINQYLGLKNNKGTEFIISLESNGTYNSKLIASHGAFLRNAKYFGNKIRNTI